MVTFQGQNLAEKSVDIVPRRSDDTLFLPLSVT
jgi:hypothetical protein